MCKSLHGQGWVRTVLSRIKHTGHLEYIIHYFEIEGIKVITKTEKLWCL